MNQHFADTAAIAMLTDGESGTAINWSAIGREHGIEGKNAGQIAREFAEACELDVEEIMSSTPKRKPTNRLCRRKLPGTKCF